MRVMLKQYKNTNKLVALNIIHIIYVPLYYIFLNNAFIEKYLNNTYNTIHYTNLHTIQDEIIQNT